MFSFLRAKGTSLLAFFASLLLIATMSTMPINAEVDAFGNEEINWDDEFFTTSDDDFMNLDYTYDTTSSDMTGAEAAAAFAIIAGVWGIIMLPIYIYFALTLMVTAKKVGLKNGWFAWIPILQIVLLFQTAGLSPWLFLLTFVPFVNVIVLVYAYMKIAERRGFESWLGILIILPIAQLIVPGYLAWGEAPKKEK